MKLLLALCLVAFVTGASAQASCGSCRTMKWATCDGPSCTCTIMVGLGAGVKQELKCDKLIPKCYLMKAEMYRAKNGLSTRSGGKPVETALVDNDGIYDPECENDGTFKAIQCNNTEICWCVNSAGVRRSDKGDKNLKCEPVETYWVRLELVHNTTSIALDKEKVRLALANALTSRYSFDTNLVKEIQYDANARMIIADVQKPKEDRSIDLPRMAYYMEKDVKVLPLFKDAKPLELNVDGTPVTLEKILVYYVDAQAPTITMQKLTGGIIAVIVVVVLAVIIGLLVLFFLNRRQARYSKAQPREMETMS